MRGARAWFACLCGIAIAGASIGVEACGGDDEAGGGPPDGSTNDGNATDGGNPSSDGSLGDSSLGDGGKPVELCNADGWCWSNPIPQGNDLRAVFAASPTNAWATGMDGALVHWDGAKWSATTSPTTKEILSMWGSSATDIWAVGEEGTVLRYDGAKWSVVPGPNTSRLWGLWGSGPNDVWVADNQQALRRWDGTKWTDKSLAFTFNARAVAGTSASDVWAVGAGASNTYGIAHFDGMNWTSSYTLDAGGFGFLTAVWAGGPNDAWAVGYYGTILRFKDGAWAPSQSNTTTANFTAVWGVPGSNDVWAASLNEGVIHWNGSTWSPATSSVTPLGAVSGTGAGDVWAVGEGGAILHGNASTWTNAVPGVTNMHFRRVWGAGPNDVWTVGYVGGVTTGSSIFHFDGNGWMASPSPSQQYLAGLWGSGPNDVWAAGAPNNVRWSGTQWTEFDSGKASNGLFGLRGIWGVSANEIYGINSDIIQWDGGGWSAMPGGYINGGGNDIWASSSANVVAVGEDGDIATWDGGVWGHKRITAPLGVSVRMHAVSGTSSNDVWATSTKGMYHYDGNDWSPVTSPAAFGVFAIAPNDAYAVDYNGKIAHWNGNTWLAEASGTSNALMAVWASATDVWVVGEYGSVLRKRRQ